MKKIFYIILACSLIIAQTSVAIYNQGRAFIQEDREIIFNQTGKQSLIIQNIPNTVDPSSINLYSDNIQFISKELFKRPITNQSLLNASIGEEIELVKYGEDGHISFSTTGKLISNTNQPVFEIDGKIVVNPPYSYRFDDILEGISDYSYLNCSILTKTKKSKYTLSYITTGLDWEAEYSLYLISHKISEIEGWYSIRNDLELAFKNTAISLVSGMVNFEQPDGIPIHTKRTKMAMSYQSEMASPEISKIGEYSVFHIKKNIYLSEKSQVRHQFLSNGSVPYESIYHISHSLQQYWRNTEAQRQQIPVYVRLELRGKDISNFQLPSGSFKVYEKKNSTLTYIGTGISTIAEGDDKIMLETGNTRDILCMFTITGYEINRHTGEVELNTLFENRKDRAVIVFWTEKFLDGRWDIIHSSIDYERLDAHHALFIVDISANSKKEISFKARIEKE